MASCLLIPHPKSSIEGKKTSSWIGQEAGDGRLAQVKWRVARENATKRSVPSRPDSHCVKVPPLASGRVL